MQPYYLTEKDLESKYGTYGIVRKEEIIKYVDIAFDHGRASLVIRLYNMCCYSGFVCTVSLGTQLEDLRRFVDLGDDKGLDDFSDKFLTVVYKKVMGRDEEYPIAIGDSVKDIYVDIVDWCGEITHSIRGGK
jgi:hypothetical protein